VKISFERPTGLAAQLHKQDQSRPDLVYFDALKNFYDKMIKHYKEDGSSGFQFSKSLSAYGFLSNRKNPKKEFPEFQAQVEWNKSIGKEYVNNVDRIFVFIRMDHLRPVNSSSSNWTVL
jgi:hypothetical protein